MAAGDLFAPKTQFSALNEGLVNESVYSNMCKIVSSFWVLVCSYLSFVFGLVFRHISRFHIVGKHHEKSGVTFSVVRDEEDEHQQNQDSEFDARNGEDRENSVSMETSSSALASKYEFLCGKDISGFIEEPKTLSFTVYEVCEDLDVGVIAKDPILDPGDSSEEDFQEAYEVKESEKQVDVFDIHESVEDVCVEEKVEKEEYFGNENSLQIQELEIFREGKISEEGIVLDSECSTDKDSTLQSEACVEEETGETEDSVKIPVIEEIVETQEQETYSAEANSEKEKVIKSQDRFQGAHNSSDEVRSLSKYDNCSNDELLEDRRESCTSELFGKGADEGSGDENPAFLDEKKVEDNQEPEVVVAEWQYAISDDDCIEFELQKQNSAPVNQETLSRAYSSKEEKSVSNFDVEDDSEFLLEHQDIIEQLKMELKQARTGGLPTILEESESEELETPKMVEELKPLKIDEKFEHKDLLAEIQKVYRSYTDKMKKLDILNFQAMHALGLLQLKDTVQPHTSQKSFVPVKLARSLWSCKQGAGVVDPMKKIIADVNRDFELVYVGQLCLSWEILHWQHWKAQELQKYDYQGHCCNEVANEFQLFQVLMQRFMENETFQGPRIHNYVNNRCVLRNLLQIPVIRDHSLKDKGKGSYDEDAITSQMVTEIIEESMRVFWEFLRTDKDESNVVLQDLQTTHGSLQDHVDLDLLTDVRTNYQKKDKRLKDILRSGNCILRRFQKHQENQVHHALFIVQVELKLVLRVLNLSRITVDQLMWCHEKLDKINFCNRKVFVEPSFLLFPC